MGMRTLARLVLAGMAGMLAPVGAHAHPHVFAEARLEVLVGGDGTIEKLQHVWRFDDLFSSTVLVEFDANADLKLDENELTAVAETVNSSLAEFNWFQDIEVEGKAVAIDRPQDFQAVFEANQLLILFSAAPKEKLKLTTGVSIGVFDPTFYTSLEFADDAMVLTGAATSCSASMHTPDPDEALAQNQATLTEAFFDDPEGNDLAKIFATRMNVSCPA